MCHDICFGDSVECVFITQDSISWKEKRLEKHLPADQNHQPTGSREQRNYKLMGLQLYKPQAKYMMKNACEIRSTLTEREPIQK